MVGRNLSERRSSFIRWSVVIVLLAMAIPNAFAQLPTATVLGTVKDASGAVVPGAAVTARNVDTGQTRNTTTGVDGAYRFEALSVGNFEVKVEHPSFKTAIRSGLTLTVTQEAVVDFSLEVGATAQTVEVTAEVPLVNTTSGSLGGLVDEVRVADLPLNGRNFIDLSMMQTGVVQQKNLPSTTAGVEGEWFSSNGAPLRSNNFLLDGAIMQDLQGAGNSSVAGTTLGIEGIREYKIITNSFSAEYGMTMGSQTVMVSKGGTNQFHGSVFEYLRNSSLDAANFFDTPQGSNGHRLPEFRRNNFGAAGGGPIRKDKLFFFGATEFLRQAKGITSIGTTIPAVDRVNGGLVPVINPLIVPLLALFPAVNLGSNQFTFPFTSPTSEDWGQMRVDGVISSSDSWFARYTIDNTTQVSPLANPNFVENQYSRNQYATVSESHIFSPTVLNTFRGSFSRTLLQAYSPANFSGPQYSLIPGDPIGSITPGSGITGFGPTLTANYQQNLYTLSDDVFYTKGHHAFKFGTLVNFYRPYFFIGVTEFGSVTFPDLAHFLQGISSAEQEAVPGKPEERTYHYRTYGFYAQDDWRMTSNFTLNIGLRYEFYTVPYDVTGKNDALRNIVSDATMTFGPIMLNPSLRDFSPRLGFAWDIFGNGKTSLRGGFAELYDVGDLGSALVQDATGKVPYSPQTAVTCPASGSASVAFCQNQTVNGVFYPAFSLPLVFPASSGGNTLRPIDYHYGQPTLLQYNLTVERQLPGQMALTVAYGGSRGVHLAQVTEGNPVIPNIINGIPTYVAGMTRRNPNWASMTLEDTGNESWYNSLQVGLIKHLTKGLQFQESLTWSKLIDQTGQGQYNVEDGGSESTFGTSPLEPKLDQGRNPFNVAFSNRINILYNLPNFVSADKMLSKFTNGWWTGSIISIQSGYPFTVDEQNNRSLSQVGGAGTGLDWPNIAAGHTIGSIISGGPSSGCTLATVNPVLGTNVIPAGTMTHTPTFWYDPCAFSLQATGTDGNAGRNTLIGPGFGEWDLSVGKDFALKFLGEGGKVEFRAEGFNILNRPNFALPNRIVFSGLASDPTGGESPLGTAGQITSTVGTSRQIQLALKVLF